MKLDIKRIDKDTFSLKPQSILKIQLADYGHFLEAYKNFKILKKEINHYNKTLWSQLISMPKANKDTTTKKHLITQLEEFERKLSLNKVLLYSFLNPNYTPMPKTMDALWHKMHRALHRLIKRATLDAKLESEEEIEEEILQSPTPPKKKKK